MRSDAQNIKPIITTKTITQTAKKTCGIVGLAVTEQKNTLLFQLIIEKLSPRKPDIIAANFADVAEAKGKYEIE